MSSPDIRNNVDTDMIRHIAITSLINFKKKFSAKYGEIIICCDSPNGYWRRDIFPHYKAGRKKARDEQDWIDWNLVYGSINQIKAELKAYFPYKVIELEKCEADDIVGVLALNATEPTIIIGSDKDYIQCQRNPNVKQWSNRIKDFVKCESPKRTLFEHIVKGDAGDGIPSVLCKDDFLINKTERAKPVTKKIFSMFLENPGSVPKEQMRNFNRNRVLIDFAFIPKDIQSKILAAKNVEPIGSKALVFDFFVKNKMKNLLDSLSDV